MKKHSDRFEKLCAEARARVNEMPAEEVKALIDEKSPFYLVDVREESEWMQARLPLAVHLGKGVIERDIEHSIPDLDAPIVLYCGGGYRSALAADNLQKMGYRNVFSMTGGYRAWSDAGYLIDTLPR